MHTIVDGKWTVWRGWSVCTRTCGGGVQGRSRSCTNPPPAFGGAQCTGVNEQTRSCNEEPCPGNEMTIQSIFNNFENVYVLLHWLHGVFLFSKPYCLQNLFNIAINLLVFYRKYRSLIGYATHYLFCFSINLLAFYHECRSLIGYVTHVLLNN